MHSYRQIFYQIVFGTKNRQPTLAKQHEEELYKYIWGVIKWYGRAHSYFF
jgi:putative transposase